MNYHIRCSRILFVAKSFRGVAQLVAHVVWDHGAGGSSPLTPTSKFKLGKAALSI